MADMAFSEPPRPAGTGGAKAAPAPVSTWTKLKAVLKKTAYGTTAVKRKDKYKVAVGFQAGGGSYFDPSINKTMIDNTSSLANQATVFVHEMNHAWYFHENKGADIVSLGRAAYVDAMLGEETTGTVAQIRNDTQQANNKVKGAGRSLGDTNVNYWKAYNAALKKAKKDHPKWTPKQWTKAADAAGWKRVRESFGNGEVITSTTGETYEVYYGNAWDAAHPTP